MSILKDLAVAGAATVFNSINEKLEGDLDGTKASVQSWINKKVKKNPSNRHLVLLSKRSTVERVFNAYDHVWIYSVCDIAGNERYHAESSYERKLQKVTIYNSDNEIIGNITEHALSLLSVSYSISTRNVNLGKVSLAMGLSNGGYARLKISGGNILMDYKSNKIILHDKKNMMFAEFSNKPFSFGDIVFADIYDSNMDEETIVLFLILSKIYSISETRVHEKLNSGC